MIKIKQLQFTYQGADQPALANISLCVKPQSIFGLLGPNGAGKTTLLSMLSGLLPCPANTIFIDDCDLSLDSNRGNSHLSLVPQDYAFYQDLTVKENLNFFAGVQGLAKPVLITRLGEVADITGLGERLNQKATTLSGGLKRRLNLAIGLLNSPKLLLLDEPTVGIDPHSRHFILEAIREINRQGTTIIYTSHYMEEV
ncbi:MAG: ABC transporter ATP-binding protein, partial [Porticoccaceae bacterium]|nr:ABC transporter ATP-binding protein [Porticoccaceae bacterium]